MRILMTGATVAQCNKLIRPGIQKIDVPATIVTTLIDAGHNVDWTALTPDTAWDIPSHYDALWVNVAGICSWHAPYAPSMLAAIAAAHRHRMPIVIFFDDWKVQSTRSHAGSFARLGETQLLKVLLGRHIYRDAVAWKPYAETLFDTAAAFSEGRWGHALVTCPMYAWGQHDIVWKSHVRDVPVQQRAFIDPTPTIPLIPRGAVSDKREGYALASLSDQRPWVARLGLQWPVTYYGARKIGADRLSCESDVQRAYAQHWGILSPKYPQIGSGWWRSRFLYGANAGSVVICDPREAAGLPNYYAAPRVLETASEAGRQDLADRQSSIFTPRCWTMQDWVSGINNLITRASNLT